MKPQITILRIDPGRRTVASMVMRCGRNATPEVRRVIRAKGVGWRELVEVHGVVLVVAAGLEAPEESLGWRLVGGHDTAGIGILFGKGPGGGMVDVPVDRAWVEKRIRWLAGEDVEGLIARAEATLPMLSPDLRAAIAGAIPALHDGSMWLRQADQTLWAAALAFGASSPSSKGQRLSPMGVKLHEMLIEG